MNKSDFRFIPQMFLDGGSRIIEAPNGTFINIEDATRIANAELDRLNKKFKETASGSPVFTVEDFAELLTIMTGATPHRAADIANAKLEKLMGPAVTCKKLGESGLTDEHGPGWIACEESVRWGKDNTHTANLFNVRKLERAECEHVPRAEANYSGNTVCAKCGTRLKAKWEAADAD